MMELARLNSPNDFPTAMRFFHETVNRLVADENQVRPWTPAVDILETENELILKADVPDVDMKDIEVRMENGTLIVRGERKFVKNEANGKGGYHRLERSYGTFERVFTLPETVEAEAVKADYKNGVLSITLPKKEVAKPRQIKAQINN